MNILSLFDGMSCGQIALNKANIKVDNYYSSEIDDDVVKVTQYNFPNTIQLGDVSSIKAPMEIDMVIGGSPCQGFSSLGYGLNFDDPRSKLFFEYLRILKEVQAYNPNVLFLLENVKMKRVHEEIISEYLGVHPIRINSSLVSAGLRDRLYWTNIKNVTQPKYKNILLNDILDYGKSERNKSLSLLASYYKNTASCGDARYYLNKSIGQLIPDDTRKSGYRKLTVKECCKIQTIPTDYFDGVKLRDAKLYKALGNSWTVDVISHIFSFLPSEFRK